MTTPETMMDRFMSWLMRGRGLQSRLSTRKCRGCDDPSFHNAHLTRYGQRRIVGEERELGVQPQDPGEGIG